MSITRRKYREKIEILYKFLALFKRILHAFIIARGIQININMIDEIRKQTKYNNIIICVIQYIMFSIKNNYIFLYVRCAYILLY